MFTHVYFLMFPALIVAKVIFEMLAKLKKCKQIHLQMAGKWEGFSEDDIKFYLKKEETTPGKRNRTDCNEPVGRRITRIGKIRKPIKEKNLISNALNNEENLALSESALLLKNSSRSGNDVQCEYLTNAPTVLSNGDGMTPATPETKDDPLPLSGESLEKFQARQRLLEEQNRQRKEFLSRILSDRKKQTTEEAKRLQQIQDELHKLDLLLSDDVSILRNEIETAAKEFGEAQKRFNKAEKEFMDAKHSMFAKMERKELLTKHLCTIIEQNELRKAQKLSQLMEKLTVDPSSQSLEASADSPVKDLPVV